MTSSTDAPAFDEAKSINAIKYEYDMALATAVRIGREKDGAIQFALIESFLVHARNLHDFLRPRTANSRKLLGDFWANDFVAEFGYEVFDQEMVNTINRWLQHLTTWRYADDHAQWHPGPMLASIYRGMNAFLADLGEEVRSGLRATHGRVGEVLRKGDLLGE